MQGLLQDFGFSSEEQPWVVQAPSGGQEGTAGEVEKTRQVRMDLSKREMTWGSGGGSEREQDSRCIHRKQLENSPHVSKGFGLCSWEEGTAVTAGAQVAEAGSTASALLVLLAVTRAPQGCGEGSPLLPE